MTIKLLGLEITISKANKERMPVIVNQTQRAADVVEITNSEVFQSIIARKQARLNN